MKRLAVVLCVFLGVILLISGYVAFHYGETLRSFNGVVVTYSPYIYLAVPLSLLGVVLVIVGMLLLLHHYLILWLSEELD